MFSGACEFLCAAEDYDDVAAFGSDANVEKDDDDADFHRGPGDACAEDAPAAESEALPEVAAACAEPRPTEPPADDEPEPSEPAEVVPAEPERAPSPAPWTTAVRTS